MTEALFSPEQEESLPTLTRIVSSKEFVSRLKEVGEFTLETGKECGFEVTLPLASPGKFEVSQKMGGTKHLGPGRPLRNLPLKERVEKLSRPQLRIYKEPIIFIHFHPNGTVPSADDIIMNTNEILGVGQIDKDKSIKLLLWQFRELQEFMLDYERFNNSEIGWIWDDFERVKDFFIREGGAAALLHIHREDKGFTPEELEKLLEFSLSAAFSKPCTSSPSTSEVMGS